MKLSEFLYVLLLLNIFSFAKKFYIIKTDNKPSKSIKEINYDDSTERAIREAGFDYQDDDTSSSLSSSSVVNATDICYTNYKNPIFFSSIRR